MGILDDAWLAGFADGEGCFSAYRIRLEKREYIQPRFDMRLRADDVAILEELGSIFGGRIYVRPRLRGHSPGAKPSAVWEVRDKASLGRLIAYFDRFPLRAKKARDYAIWQRIVRLYITRGGVRDIEEMEVLRAALVAGRAYETLGVETPVAVPEPPQLRIVAGI